MEPITFKDIIMFAGFIITIAGATWKMSGLINALKEEIIGLKSDLKHYVVGITRMEAKVDSIETSVKENSMELVRRDVRLNNVEEKVVILDQRFAAANLNS